MRTCLNHHSCALPRVLAVFFTLGFAGQLSFSESGEEWHGLVVAPEKRCAPYNADEYSYPQSVEPQIADHLGGVYSPYTCETFRSYALDPIFGQTTPHIVVTHETC